MSSTSFGQVLNGRVQRESIVLRPAPRRYMAAMEPSVGDVPAADAEWPPRLMESVLLGMIRSGIDLHQYAQARAGGAGAVGIVEGEHARGQLLDGDAAVRTGVILGKQHVLAVRIDVHDHQPAGQVHAPFPWNRSAAAAMSSRMHQPVYHDLDACAFCSCPAWASLRKFVDFAVDPHAHIAAASGMILQNFGVFALAAAHHRREHLDASCAPAAAEPGPQSDPPSAAGFLCRISGSAACRCAHTAAADNRESPSPCPRWNGGCCWWFSGRWRWRGKARRCNPRPACPSAPETCRA